MTISAFAVAVVVVVVAVVAVVVVVVVVSSYAANILQNVNPHLQDTLMYNGMESHD